MARILGVSGFGTVMIGLTVLSYVSLGGSAGIHVFGTRGVAAVTLEFSPGELLGARLLNTAVAYVLVGLVTVAFVADSPLRMVILVTSASGFITALFLEWLYQGKERMSENAIARTIGAGVYLAVIVFGVRTPDDLRTAAFAAIAGDIASTGFLLSRYIQEFGPLDIRISFHQWMSLMRKALPFGAGSLLGHLSTNFPVIAIGIMLGSADAGVFSGANKLVFFLLMIDRILGTVLLPASARLHSASRESLRSALEETLRWIVILGLPLAVGGTLLGSELVVLVYGNAFASAGPVFAVLIWYVFLTMVHTVYTSGVMAAGGEIRYRNVMIMSAALYGITVTAGTAFWGVMGAAVGVLASEGITVIAMRNAMESVCDPVRPARFGRTALAAFTLAVVILLLPTFHVLVTVLIGCVSYALALMTFRVVSWNDMKTLTQRII